MRIARERLPSLFDWFTDGNDPANNALRYAVDTLGSDIDFRKFDSNVLSQIYEEVLVDPSQRRKLGIHYTPVDLANKMLAHLPIEEIKPDERHVLDPACGSGTLLVAAHDRLSQLQPAYWNALERHTDLRTRLRGQDKDPLAVELTKLALVLHAVPTGNGWSISQKDSLDHSPLPPLLDSSVQTSGPSIIVANPPFELPVNEGARLDVAVQFLDVMLEELAPGGLIATILPASWLSGTASTRDSRSRLQGLCDTFEVWRLPRDTFHQSRANTIVLFARKRPESEGKGGRTLALVQHVPSSTALPAFYKSLPTGSGRTIVDPFSRTGPVQSMLKNRRGLIGLGDLVRVKTGAQPVKGHLDSARRGDFRDEDTIWLPHLTGLPQYCPVMEDHLLRTTWPDGFLRNLDREAVDSPKVLVGTQATSDSPYLRVVIDDDGIVASKSLLWLIPKPQAPTHTGLDFGLVFNGSLALAASGLLAAWLDEVSTGRNIRSSDLSRFPVPRLPEAWSDLAEIGLELREAAQSRHLDRALLLRLEDAVFRSYGLQPDDAIVAAVSARLADVRDSAIGQPRYEPSSGSDEYQPIDPLECDAVVREIDVDRVRIEIPGVTTTEGSWVDLPPGMTGRMSEPGAKVVVTLGESDNLFRARYKLHRTAWADEYEVEELLRAETDVETT